MSAESVYSSSYFAVLEDYSKRTFAEWCKQTQNWDPFRVGEVVSMRVKPRDDKEVLGKFFYKGAQSVKSDDPRYKARIRISVLANLSDEVLDTILDSIRFNYRKQGKEINWDLREVDCWKIYEIE